MPNEEIQYLKFVGTTGVPLENAGYLTPVFKTARGSYFECGGETNFGQGEMDKIIGEGAGILFKPLSVGKRFKISDLYGSPEEPTHCHLNASVAFFSDLAVKSIGRENLERISLENKGTVLELINKLERGDDSYSSFYLFEKKDLVCGFVPKMIDLCADNIDTIIEKRKEEVKHLEYLVESERDPVAQLGQVMTNISFEDTIEKAVSYYGKILRLSPFAKNFDAWFNFVCDRWGLNETQIRDRYFNE